MTTVVRPSIWFTVPLMHIAGWPRDLPKENALNKCSVLFQVHQSETTYHNNQVRTTDTLVTSIKIYTNNSAEVREYQTHEDQMTYRGIPFSKLQTDRSHILRALEHVGERLTLQLDFTLSMPPTVTILTQL